MWYFKKAKASRAHGSQVWGDNTTLIQTPLLNPHSPEVVLQSAYQKLRNYGDKSLTVTLLTSQTQFLCSERKPSNPLCTHLVLL